MPISIVSILLLLWYWYWVVPTEVAERAYTGEAFTDALLLSGDRNYAALPHGLFSYAEVESIQLVCLDFIGIGSSPYDLSDTPFIVPWPESC